MKRILLSIIVAVLASTTFSTAAQDMADLRARTVRENKLEKVAKKEAKEKKNEGWKPYGGSAMLERQILERLTRENMINLGRKVHLMGYGVFISDDPGAAINFARERAIKDISGQLGQKFAEATKLNTVVDKVSGKSLNDAKANAMSVIEQELGVSEPVVMMVREAKHKPGYYEASVAIAYDRKLAEETAARAALESIETEDPALQKALQEAFDRMNAE